MDFARKNGNGGPYFIRMKGNNTTGVIGLISPIDTTGRPSPPQPSNGFVTSHTPFGNGHVFALSLGGSDSRKNIVPQWEQWQQTGTWRMIEVQCEKFAGSVFRCEVDYDIEQVDDYDQLWEEFQNDRLIHWTDPRLPIRFKVRVYAMGDLYDAYHAVNDAQSYDAFAAKLDNKHAVYDPGWVDHATMPPEDRRYWQDQTIGSVLQDMHSDFLKQEEDRALASGQSLQRTVSFTGFVMHPDTMKDLQKSLEDYNGFTPTDIAGVKGDTMLRSTHKMSTKKIRDERVRYTQMYKAGGTRHNKKRADLSEFAPLTRRQKKTLGLI